MRRFLVGGAVAVIAVFKLVTKLVEFCTQGIYFVAEMDHYIIQLANSLVLVLAANLKLSKAGIVHVPNVDLFEARNILEMQVCVFGYFAGSGCDLESRFLSLTCSTPFLFTLNPGGTYVLDQQDLPPHQAI